MGFGTMLYRELAVYSTDWYCIITVVIKLARPVYLFTHTKKNSIINMIKPGSHFRNDVESTSLALIQRIVSSGVARAIKHINPYNAEIYLYKPWRSKCYFQFKIIRNVLALPALILSVRGTSFTSADVRF